ncbi:helix-turn-helix domain-containing protein [Kitasatospora sp. NPDC004272]
MNDFSAQAMGQVIREHRQARQPLMTQVELARKAEYGKGGEVSVSRIESGLISPGAHRLAAIALALRLTPEQLRQEAEDRTRLLAEQQGPPPEKFRERVAETKRRYAEVTEKVAQRTKITEEHGEAFNRAYDDIHAGFFLRFVELAASIGGAPEPDGTDADEPGEGEVATTREGPAAIRVRAISAGIAGAVRDAAGGAVGAAAGAAVGTAAAYTTFAAAAAFGTASTGTAITALYGAAATNATLAVLGGGTLAAGGAGMAGGVLLLAGIVAAPAVALAATGFYVLKKRRTKKEEERLRTEIEAAEAVLGQSQRNFDTTIEVLGRATAVMEYIQVHGTHALERWAASLPPEPRNWESLGAHGQERYQEFLTVAGSFLAVSTINVPALLTAEPAALREMDQDIDQMLRYADRTVRAVV